MFSMRLDPNKTAIRFLYVLDPSKTIKSSATFATTEVSDIGRRCLFISFTDFCFGSGTSSAFFNDCGRQPFLNEEFKIFTRSDNNSVFSFNIQLGIPSGPLISLSRIEFSQLH